MQAHCLNPFCGTKIDRMMVDWVELHCPACGRPLFAGEPLAARGRHVLLLGMILAALMGLVASMLGPGMIARIAHAPTTFRGTAFEAFLLSAGLIGLFSFGCAFMASGVLMIAGRSSRAATLSGIILFGVSLLAIAGALVSAYRA